MTKLPSALLPLAVAAALSAQTMTVPAAPFTGGEDTLPLAASPTRYQQWFSAPEMTSVARVPVRIRAMGFVAGNVLQNGNTVDIEIRMAHLRPNTLPSATFANNLAEDNTLVFPRAVVTLASRPQAGARVVTFNFVREFVWNGLSGIVIDIKVFGNGNGNQSYLYPCRTANGIPGRTMRLFAPGNPANLQQATLVQNGMGLVTQFDYADGVTVSFGAGCPGTGGLAPSAGTNGGLPIPPNPSWTHTVTNVLPGAPAVFVAGASRTTFNGLPLPIDLGLIGFPGCALHVEALLFIPTSASLGGVALMPLPVPGVTLFRRQMFTQWFVLDPGASNGGLAASQALWHVFG